jgi:hypothetical protein
MTHKSKSCTAYHCKIVNQIPGHILNHFFLMLHSKENLKHIFPKSQLRDLASKYQIHIPITNFIILCGPSLPMSPKARVVALISVMPKLISAVYQQLDCQTHTAEQLLPGQAAWVALPCVHHSKITPTGPQSFS